MLKMHFWFCKELFARASIQHIEVYRVSIKEVGVNPDNQKARTAQTTHMTDVTFLCQFF